MDNTQEIWKPIKNYEYYYEVSNLGRVKSKTRLHATQKGKLYTVHEKILESIYFENEYIVKTLRKGLDFEQIGVHRLVAEMFIPNPLNKPQVNHKNGKKWDNRADNLEWATSLENINHAIDTGLIIVKKGQESHLSKLKECDVLDIRNKHERKTIKELALEYDVTTDNIRCIVSRKTWKHI